MFYHWSIKLHVTKALGGVHANLHTFLTSPGDSSKPPRRVVVKKKCSILVGILIPVVQKRYRSNSNCTWALFFGGGNHEYRSLVIILSFCMQYLCAMRVVMWRLTNRTTQLMAEFTTRPVSRALSLHPLIASNTDGSSVFILYWNKDAQNLSYVFLALFRAFGKMITLNYTCCYTRYFP